MPNAPSLATLTRPFPTSCRWESVFTKLAVWRLAEEAAQLAFLDADTMLLSPKADAIFDACDAELCAVRDKADLCDAEPAAAAAAASAAVGGARWGVAARPRSICAQGRGVPMINAGVMVVRHRRLRPHATWPPSRPRRPCPEPLCSSAAPASRTGGRKAGLSLEDEPAECCGVCAATGNESGMRTTRPEKVNSALLCISATQTCGLCRRDRSESDAVGIGRSAVGGGGSPPRRWQVAPRRRHPHTYMLGGCTRRWAAAAALRNE